MAKQVEENFAKELAELLNKYTTSDVQSVPFSQAFEETVENCISTINFINQAF